MGPMSEAHERLLSVITYNCQSCTSRTRCEDILARLRSDFIGLQSTQRKMVDQHRERHYVDKFHKSHIVHFPWCPRQRLCNKSCGVAIVARLPVENIHQVFPGDERVQGRFGAVRYRKGGPHGYDVCIMTSYFPPEDASAQTERVVELMLASILDTLQQLPARCTPVLTQDTNGKAGLVEQQIMEPVMGRHSWAQSSERGLTMMAFCAFHQLKIANSFMQGGNYATYHAGDHQSQIDHVIVPQTMELQKVYTLTSAGFHLQLAKFVPQSRDHCPVKIIVNYKLDHWLPRQRRHEYSVDRICTMWQSGRLQDYYDVLHRNLQHSADSIHNERHNADKLFETLQEVIAISLTEVCPAVAKAKPQRTGATLRKIQEINALRKRYRALREGVTNEEKMQVWSIRIKIGRLDKEISKMKRADWKAYKNAFIAQLHEAADAGDARTTWQLARRLGGKSIGARNRFVKAFPRETPTSTQWEDYLKQAPTEAGWAAQVSTNDETQPHFNAMEQAHAMPKSSAEMEVYIQGLQQHQQDPRQPHPAAPAQDAPHAPTLAERVTGNRDARNALHFLRRSKNRKSVPSHALHKEAWQVTLMFPAHLSRARRQQLRFQARNWAYNIWEQACCNVRASGLVVSQWMLAEGCQIPKPSSTKPGCAAWRIVSLLCPLGKSWFMQLWKRHPDQHQDHMSGFVHLRRRQQSMLQQACLRWRVMHQLKSGFVSTFYDIKNAFPSVSWEALELANRQHCAGNLSDEALLNQRHQRCLILVRAQGNCRTLLRPTSGGMQGDKPMPLQA